MVYNDPSFPLIRMPLICRDKVWGIVFIIGTKKKLAFSDDAVKVVTSLSAQIAVAFENAALSKDAERTYFETIAALAVAVEAKDTYSHGHAQRVGWYAEQIARAMGLNNKDLVTLKDAACLHDIGKIGITDEVLNKPGALSLEEREIIRKHPIIGESIIRPLKTFAHLLDPVRHHHEFLDGSGYPDGLKGDQITLMTRILTVADIFDAISGKRVYREAMTIADCKKALQDMVDGGKLDAKVVAVLFDLLDRGQVQV